MCRGPALKSGRGDRGQDKGEYRNAQAHDADHRRQQARLAPGQVGLPAGRIGPSSLSLLCGDQQAQECGGHANDDDGGQQLPVLALGHVGSQPLECRSSFSGQPCDVGLVFLLFRVHVCPQYGDLFRSFVIQFFQFPDLPFQIRIGIFCHVPILSDWRPDFQGSQLSCPSDSFSLRCSRSEYSLMASRMPAHAIINDSIMFYSSHPIIQHTSPAPHRIAAASSSPFSTP